METRLQIDLSFRDDLLCSFCPQICSAKVARNRREKERWRTGRRNSENGNTKRPKRPTVESRTDEEESSSSDYGFSRLGPGVNVDAKIASSNDKQSGWIKIINNFFFVCNPSLMDES
jgi:hypothetical protein